MNADGPSTRGLILLDANVLLLLYVGLYDVSLIASFKRTRAYTEEDFELLKTIVNGFPGVATTPQILAEVSNLASHLPSHRRQDYFEAFAKWMALLTETYTPARTLSEESVFGRLGLTDSSIVKLARDSTLVVLTADVDLYVHLLSIGVEACNFNNSTTVGRFVEDLSARL